MAINTNRATILPDVGSYGEPKPEKSGSSDDKYAALAAWVVGHTDEWRTWRDSQYASKWDEYERLWRGIWSSSEQLRTSERSKIVSPALSEAVENAAAEIEEATFGRGVDYFDLTPYNAPPEEKDEAQEAAIGGMVQGAAAQQGQTGMPPQQAMQGAPGMPPAEMMPPPGMMGGDPAPEKKPSIAEAVRDAVETIRTNLKEDLARSSFAAGVSEGILGAAVFGLGIGEIVTKTYKVKTPSMPQASVEELEIGGLRPVSVRNFVYDTNATNVDDGLGVAIEENMSIHTIRMAQKAGTFRKEAEVEAGDPDPTLSGDQVGDGGKVPGGSPVHVIRYFGLVPRKLLEASGKDEKVVSLYPKESDGAPKADVEDGDYVEAIVVIANKSAVLKAESNPYMMGDRPVVIFPWDIVPGRLQGRGICEKGVNSQKVLDAEIRARLDALALTGAPMMGMDANRIPRGFQFKIRPGASVLTNGNPKDTIMPFKFGELDPNHWQNLQACEAMVARATGSVDASAMSQGMGDARSGAVSMSLAPIIKRYKRTMVHFLDSFLMPALEKITYRNMQTMPERYPMAALKFKAASTMGIMQREYETSQLTQLLSVLKPETAEHRAVLMGLVTNMSLPNREQMLDLINSGEERERIALAMAAQQQVDPEQQQLKSVSIQLEIAEKQAKIEKLQSESLLNQAKAAEVHQMSEVKALEVATKGMYAVPAEQQRDEWDRRVKMAELVLQDKAIGEKAADRESNERIASDQMTHSTLNNDRVSKLEQKLRDAEQEIEITRDEKGRVSGARSKKKSSG